MDVPLEDLPSPELAPIDTPPSPGLDISANREPRVLGVAAFLFAITFIVVSLRFVGRYLSKAGIWWDDWVCLAAMLVAWGTCILCFLSPGYNFGKHEAATDPMDALENSEAFFKALYAYETLYTVAVALAKYSIILFYARIFTERSFRRTLWVIAALITIWFIVVQIVQLVQCRPLSALWDGTYAENCIDVVRMFTVAGAVNCFFNFVLLVIPLPMVWGLEIDRKAKIGLSITFLLGVFVFAVSIARLPIVAGLRQVDVTWTYVDVAIWTTVEPNIAVVSASLPILRSLWILLNPHRSIQTRSTQASGLHKSARRDRDQNYTEKTVVFADKDIILQPRAPKSPANSLFRGMPPRTKTRSFHHNTPVSSAYGGSIASGGNDLVSPIYDGGHMSPGGISDISGITTEGMSRKPTIRSENSMTPLTEASELSAHRSLPYGGGAYPRYTVNISSESANRGVTEKPSIVGRMSLKSPKLGTGGSSPRTAQNSGRSSFEEERSFEMSKLPIQGGAARRNMPSLVLKGPMKIERTQGSTRRQQTQDSGSLIGYPPPAELYA